MPGNRASLSPKQALNAALIRLARDPHNVQALAEAGKAALAMGDAGAAAGFFTRAYQLAPGDSGIAAELAGVKVMAGDPVGALSLFEAAERGGPMESARIADRGLAYDLVGDNADAQRLYREALAGGAGDEASRRLALSLAITGDERGSGAALAPLLARQDRAAWRTRTFALAILGREEEAVTTARSIMPQDLALAIAPYLRYMRRLTHAQQAAAANLGQFPQPAEIGTDSPAIVAWQSQHDRTRLAGEPAPAARAPSPPRVVAPSQAVTSRPPIASRAVVEPASPKPLPALEPVPAASPVPVQVAAAPAPVAAPRATTPTAVSPERRTPAGRHEEHREPSFAEAFAAFDTAIPRPDVVPEAGAVDIRKIKAPRPAPKAPPPPKYPSRIWVQIGVGRSKDRLAFTWHRLVSDHAKLFRHKSPSTTRWVRTNRLLVGPFDSEDAAHAWLDKADSDLPGGFVWISPEGQAVDPLGTE